MKDNFWKIIALVALAASLTLSVITVIQVKGLKTSKLGANSYTNSGGVPTVVTDLRDTGDLGVDGAMTVTGATTVGAFTSTGASTLGRFVQGGTATALTAVATSSLTAAQVCNSSFISITPVSTTPTITLPSSSTLFAACLGTVGQVMDVNFQAITTSSILAAGAGGTSLNSSSLTIAAGKAAILRFVHDTTNTYLVFVVNLLN